MKEHVLSVTKKDVEMQTFRSGGPGGQNQNKTSSGVRFIHRPSRAVGESREHRTQLENKRAAFQRMAKHWRFRLWIDKQFASEEIEQNSTRRYTYKGKEISLETRKMDRE